MNIAFVDPFMKIHFMSHVELDCWGVEGDYWAVIVFLSWKYVDIVSSSLESIVSDISEQRQANLDDSESCRCGFKLENEYGD